MTQLVVILVGQCENQIGCCFWDLALREHAAVSQKGICYEAISTVLIDMVEGIVNEILQGPLRDVFDTKQLITDTSGSGNNWAVDHKVFGSLYQDQVLEKLRKLAEHCDCLQCFFIIHSSGGTGICVPLGTFLLKVLEGEFPEVCRFMTSIYPSGEEDSLFDIISKVDLIVNSGKLGTTVDDFKCCGFKKPNKPFVAVNNIVANLLNLTSSARFEGSLNKDRNEISMNLVPFPQLHYLVSSLTPLYTLADVNIPTKRLDQMFSNAFSKDHQLLQADPKHSLYLTCVLMVRGNVQILHLCRNIERLKPSLQFPVPPVDHFYSLLALANNTYVKFMRLYKKKAHLHHCLQVEGMEESYFTEAVLFLSALIQEWPPLYEKNIPVQDLPSLSIAVYKRNPPKYFLNFTFFLTFLFQYFFEIQKVQFVFHIRKYFCLKE
uniref:Tubulin/FtsZ GTPase domain-containing protein n=1 Tax=Pan paniscus TaxID=9597 RepID=A0A2R9C5K5_PANPA